MSHSRNSHRDERFHAHHSGTYSASAETLGPDELLALAPNEFVRPETFLQALYVLPQNLLIACMKAYPTCSADALEALTTHGAMGGLSLTVRRILRCVPWATGGIDPVPEGKRTFAPGAEPKIILLNHPHLYTPHTGGDARPE